MASKLILFPMLPPVEKPASLATIRPTLGESRGVAALYAAAYVPAGRGASNKQPSLGDNAPARIAVKLARLDYIHAEAVGDVEGLVDNLLAAFDPDYGKGS